VRPFLSKLKLSVFFFFSALFELLLIFGTMKTDIFAFAVLSLLLFLMLWFTRTKTNQSTPPPPTPPTPPTPLGYEILRKNDQTFHRSSSDDMCPLQIKFSDEEAANALVKPSPAFEGCKGARFSSLDADGLFKFDMKAKCGEKAYFMTEPYSRGCARYGKGKDGCAMCPLPANLRQNVSNLEEISEGFKGFLVPNETKVVVAQCGDMINFNFRHAHSESVETSHRASANASFVKNAKPPNVLIVMIDTVGRSIFRHRAEKTLAYLTEIGGIEVQDMNDMLGHVRGAGNPLPRGSREAGDPQHVKSAFRPEFVEWFDFRRFNIVGERTTSNMNPLISGSPPQGASGVVRNLSSVSDQTLFHFFRDLGFVVGLSSFTTPHDAGTIEYDHHYVFRKDAGFEVGPFPLKSGGRLSLIHSLTHLFVSLFRCDFVFSFLTDFNDQCVSLID
jgi:hypothetical protein